MTVAAAAVKTIGTSKGKGAVKDSVANPNQAYLAMLERWELVRDLMGGTPSMRAAGEKWLRKFPNETAKIFKARVNVTTLFNVFTTTITTLVGRVFREQIKLTDETDARIVEWSQDVDRQGRDLSAYGRDCLTDMIAFGKCHTMPEFPNTEILKQALNKPLLDLADERDHDVRPFFSKVSPLSLIGWRGIAVAGQERLARIRILEQNWVPTGDWTQSLEEVIRVVYSHHVQLHTEVQGEWKPGPEIKTSLGEVNLLTGYGRRTGFLMSAPVLEDLAWLNQKHWNSQSDQDNILHVVRAAILLCLGFTKDQLKYVQVGPSIALQNENTDASVEFVEHSGRGIEAGAKSLQALVEEMEASGAGDLLVPKPGNETATGRAITEAKVLSPLQSMALSLQDHLEQSFKMSGRWIGEKDIAVGVRVNTDLGAVGEITKEIELLQKDQDAGRIANRDYLREAQSRGLYDSETDVDDLLQNAMDEIDADMPTGDDVDDDEGDDD